MSRCGAGLVETSFNRINPEAVNWVDNYSFELIRGITDESKAAIRNVIARAFSEGIPPRDAARLIRASVGLTDGQAQAVVNMRADLISKGVSFDVATARANRYAGRLARQRAENIARTETMRASNEGQRQLWRQAQDRGYLPRAQQRVWIATEDERVCPVCGKLDGKRAALNGQFAGGHDGPPAHPSCRCTQGLAPAKARTASEQAGNAELQSD